MGISTGLRAVDIYRRVPRDLTEASPFGGLLSALAVLVSALLFVEELRSFASRTAVTDMLVDRSLDGDALRINFNISLPALSCEFATVDVTDIFGGSRRNVTKTVAKFPIGEDMARGRYRQYSGPDTHELNLVWEERPSPASGSATGIGVKGADPARLAALEAEGEHDAVHLTHATWSAYAERHAILVVNFYAPWCGWSRRLAPVYTEAARQAHETLSRFADAEKVPLRFARVDCTREELLCRQHHVSGYPTIRVVRNGVDERKGRVDGRLVYEHENYYGDRTVEALLEYAVGLVKEHTGQALTGTAQDDIDIGEAIGGADADRAPSLMPGDDGGAPMHVRKPRTPATGGVARGATGCALEGFVVVSKIPGELVIAARSQAHSLAPDAANLTHVVHHIGFGRPLAPWMRAERAALAPDRPLWGRDERGRAARARPRWEDRMAGQGFLSREPNATHEHYLQVVLTTVESARAPPFDSYEYTAHSHSLPLQDAPPHVRELGPAAVFSYALSPMQVVVTEQPRRLAHFMVQLCAITGGIFTTLGVVNGGLHGMGALLRKKIELGKQN